MQESAVRSRFRRRLLAWFDRHQRDLPWRRKKSLYRVWVSEIMLQQTQVDTVVAYFNRFVKQFPTVEHLASADESTVLHAWEGLGYYRRASQMHAAAKKIVAEHNGRFPNEFQDVLALPGVGRYTAGAILSIAADQQHPVLEGNTIRLFSRLMNFRDDATSTSGQRQLWEFAESIVSRNRPGDTNQALMELGSQICKTAGPDCLNCPVSSFCKAFLEGEPATLPNKGSSKTLYESLHQAVVVVQRGQKVVLRRCGPGEHWSGLWDFPRFTIAKLDSQKAIARDLAGQLKKQTGLSVSLVPTGLPVIKHAVTRFRISLDSYRAQSISGRLRAIADQLEWVPKEELILYPMSVTGRKVARLLINESAASIFK